MDWPSGVGLEPCSTHASHQGLGCRFGWASLISSGKKCLDKYKLQVVFYCNDQHDQTITDKFDKQ